MRPKTLEPVLDLVCDHCSGTGNATVGGGRNSLKDTCTKCGGSGRMKPRTGETPEASAPAQEQSQ